MRVGYGGRNGDDEDINDDDLFGPEEAEEYERQLAMEENEGRKMKRNLNQENTNSSSNNFMNLANNMKSAFIGDDSKPTQAQAPSNYNADPSLNLSSSTSSWIDGIKNYFMGTTTSSTGSDESSSSSLLTMQIKDFVDSNNIIVKISVLVLSIFLFYIFLKIIIHLIVYYFSPKAEVILLDGMMESTGQMIINQNIASNPWKTIMRSVNERDGIEFTWSIWVKINRINPGLDYNLLFTKGNKNISSLTSCRGANVPLNGPGLYIVNDSATNSATLVVFMDTFEAPAIYEDLTTSSCSITQPSITIPHIPTDAWVHLLVRCVGNTLDVYVNGLIAKTITFATLPKQNYGDIYVGSNGGFSGNISNLIYFNHSLNNQEIQNLFSKGPSLKSVDLSTDESIKQWFNYLSFDWYFRPS